MSSETSIHPGGSATDSRVVGAPLAKDTPDQAVAEDTTIPLLMADGNKIPPGPYLWGPKERPLPGLVIGDFSYQGGGNGYWGYLVTDLLKKRVSFVPEAFIPCPRNSWIPYLYSYRDNEDLHGTSEEDLIKAVKSVGEDYGLIGSVDIDDDDIHLKGRLYSKKTDTFSDVFNLYGNLDEVSVLLSKAAKAVINGMEIVLTDEQSRFIDRPFPKDGETVKKMAQFWDMGDKSIDEFVKDWEELQSVNQDDDYICAVHGSNLLYRDNKEDIRYFQQMRKKFPGHDIFHLRQIGYLNNKHFDVPCLEEIKSYLGRNPTDLWVMLDLRDVYMRRKDYPRMLGAAMRYSRIVPESYLGWECVGDAAYDYAWGKRGGGYINTVSREDRHSYSTMLDLSEKYYRKSLDIWPDNADVWATMISVSMERGYPLSEIERAFRRAVELREYNPRAYRNYIMCFTPGWRNDRAKAQSLWEEAKGKYPDRLAMARLPIPYLRTYAVNVGKETAAHDPWFREQKLKAHKDAAHTSESTDGDIVRYAEYLTELERYDEAIAEFELVMSDGKLDYPRESRHEYYVRYAEVLAKVGQKDRAIEKFEMCLQNEPCNDCRYVSLQQLGKLYGETANFQKSMDYYHKAIRFRPDSDYARHNFAYFAPRAKGFIDEKEFEKLMDEAEGYAQALVDKEPNNDIYLLTLAKVLYVKGERGDALDIMDEAIEKSGGKEGYINMRKKMEDRKELWPWLKNSRE